MKLDVTKYRNQAAGLIRMIDNSPEKDIQRAISMTAIVTHTPILAIVFMYGEVKGFDDTLNSMIERLTKFYQYDEIIK